MTGPDFIRIDARLIFPIIKEYKLYVELVKRPNPEDEATPQCSEKILVATYKVGEKCLTKSKVIYNLSKDHGYTAKFSWDYDYLNTAVPPKCAKTYFYTNSLCKSSQDPDISSPEQGDSIKLGEKILVKWSKTKHAKDDKVKIYLCKQIDGMNDIKMSLLGATTGDSTSFSTIITKDILKPFEKSNLYGTYTDHMYFISMMIECKNYKKCKGASTFVRGVNTFSILDMSEPMINWPLEP